MTNQVATIEKTKAPAKVNAVIPQNRTEISEFSVDLIAAGMVPNSYNKGSAQEVHAKLCMCITKGLEIGMPPMMALQSIYIINNIPAIYGDGAIALVQRSGKIEWMKETIEGKGSTDNWTAVCEIKRVGQEEPYRRTFSFEQAKRAKLATKPGPWMAYPERMLQMRARALALRDGFADVLCGLGIAEEVQDIPVQQESVSTAFLDDGDDTDAIEDHSTEQTQEEQPADKPKADPEDWANKFIAAVKACATVDEVNALHTKHQTVLDRYADEYEDTYQRMRDAEDARIEQLSQEAA
ncbi:MAG: recombinase RecT [Thalassospira sp.]|uniref:recombinase RecT n=1 Tax=Thalassospira sp. TaxID=1912094 RepID=UPI003A879104